MSEPGRIPSGEYVEVEYEQFRPRSTTRRLMAALGVFTWPVTIPLALMSRASDIVFRSCSELLSLLPYFPGVIARAEFYRFALRSCGRNVVVEFGAVFVYRDVKVGDDVLIGRFSIIHHCDIGSQVLIGERVTLLSGSRQHRYDTLDVPIALQGGYKRRILIGDDCWLGSHATVMADVAEGSVVAAGAVVTQPVAARSIVGGVPAQLLRQRTPG